MIHSNASDLRITLQWVSDDHLLEASSTQLSVHNRLGQQVAHKQEGAKLLAYYPSAGFIRYLSFPTQAREHFTFCDWDWAKGTALDLNEGSIYTHCCAFDLQGNFFHGGDWEDGGYWSGIDCLGQRINGGSNMPILFDMKCSPDGNRLLLGGRRSYFAIWSFPDLAYKADKTFEIPGGIVSAVAWSGSGTYVAAHSTMGNVLIWDLQRVLPVANIPAPPSHKLLKQKLLFVPGAEHLIWIGMDTCVQLINWRRKLLVHTIPDCRAFDLSPSGEHIAFRREEDTSPVFMSLKSLN